MLKKGDRITKDFYIKGATEHPYVYVCSNSDEDLIKYAVVTTTYKLIEQLWDTYEEALTIAQTIKSNTMTPGKTA